MTLDEAMLRADGGDFGVAVLDFGVDGYLVRRARRSTGSAAVLCAAKRSTSFERARLRRLLIVPISTSQIAAASS